MSTPYPDGGLSAVALALPRLEPPSNNFLAYAKTQAQKAPDYYAEVGGELGRRLGYRNLGHYQGIVTGLWFAGLVSDRQRERFLQLVRDLETELDRRLKS